MPGGVRFRNGHQRAGEFTYVVWCSRGEAVDRSCQQDPEGKGHHRAPYSRPRVGDDTLM